MRLPPHARVLFLTIASAIFGAAINPGFSQTAAISPAMTPPLVPAYPSAFGLPHFSISTAAAHLHALFLVYAPGFIGFSFFAGAAFLAYCSLKNQEARLKPLLFSIALLFLGLFWPIVFSFFSGSGCGLMY